LKRNYFEREVVKMKPTAFEIMSPICTPDTIILKKYRMKKAKELYNDLRKDLADTMASHCESCNNQKNCWEDDFGLLNPVINVKKEAVCLNHRRK